MWCDARQDGKVPRDIEYERVRQYIVRRCRYAAALIMNVQLPNQVMAGDSWTCCALLCSGKGEVLTVSSAQHL